MSKNVLTTILGFIIKNTIRRITHGTEVAFKQYAAFIIVIILYECSTLNSEQLIIFDHRTIEMIYFDILKLIYLYFYNIYIIYNR